MILLILTWVYTYLQFTPRLEPRAYYTTAPLWHIILHAIIIFLPLFASPAYFDLRRALRLLTEPTHQPPEQPHNQTGGWKHP